MTEVSRHYDELLAEHYTWMSGGLAANLARAGEFFARHRIVPRPGGVAFDLGAGSGFQTLPLARAGFKVYAVDLSDTLLRETEEAAKDLPVVPVRSDLLRFLAQPPEPAELIVCMGDTLTHLASGEEVAALFAAAQGVLVPPGRIVLTFRDLSIERRDLDRFLPLRSERGRIFTCFLEYERLHVRVHDLVHVRAKDGTWNLHKSAYRKLRLAGDRVAALLEAAGFLVTVRENQQGLITLIATNTR
jgi:SAM-dependent methyltransferase